MKRVFGKIEVIFDILYLSIACLIGLYLLFTGNGLTLRTLAGLMAIVLAGGDVFHLIPRIHVINTGREELYRRSLGHGKQITSITMTVFYIMLLHIAQSLYRLDLFTPWTIIVYILALMRIVLCLMPQNHWVDRYPPISWGIYRNIPFFIMGVIIAFVFYQNRDLVSAFYWTWLVILLSFGFYLPVVLYANKNPKIGMLMLPKTLMYVWLLVMCLSI
jgi:hypothetical protein